MHPWIRELHELGLPAVSCPSGMEMGWESSVFYKRWLLRGLDSRTLMLTSHSSMFVFIACKKKKKRKSSAALFCVTADLTFFLGRFSPLPLLFFIGSALRMCHAFTARSLWMGRGKRGGGSSSGMTLWYCINSCFIIIKKKMHSKDF